MDAIRTTINMLTDNSFTAAERQKLDQAVKLLTAAINSDGFQRLILEHEYNGTFQFSRNNGLSNRGVYDMFMSGKEKRTNTIDHELDLQWSISDDCPATAIGTTFGKRRTETYRCKLEEMSAASFAGHIAHEYCHYLGFGHTKKYIPSRPFTVPYAIGSIVRNLCAAQQLALSSEETINLLALNAMA